MKRLERNGYSQVAGGVGRVGGGGCCAREVLGTMQQEYPLLCEPLSSFRIHSTSSPLCKSSLLSIPAVCRSGREPHQKVLELGIERVDGEKQGGKQDVKNQGGGQGTGA